MVRPLPIRDKDFADLCDINCGVLNLQNMSENLPKKITFDDVPKTLAQVSNDIIFIKDEMSELRKSFEPKKPPELMTRKEVAEFFKCDESTVHNWTEKGKLKKYGIGERVYWIRSEVEAALKAI